MAKKIRTKWTYDLEMVLLDLWQEKIGDLRRQKRNSHVYNEMANLLEQSSASCSNVDGADVKNKINNFTQRYRTETKTMGQFGGSRSPWIHFEKIHEIIGSLPSNDLSLMSESLSFPNISNHFNPSSGDVLLYVEDDTEQEGMDLNEIMSVASGSGESLPSPSTSLSLTSPCSIDIPVPIRREKYIKRKMRDNFDKELLNEIKRSNDLSEKEAIESRHIRLKQLERHLMHY